MDGRVLIQLRVESRDQLVPLAGGDDVAVHFCQHLGLGADGGDVGGADEGHGDLAHAFHLGHGVEAAQLPPVGVALGGQVHGGEAGDAALHLVGQQDQARAGAVDGQTSPDLLLQRLEQVQVAQELAHHGALAAGQDEAVQGLFQIALLADLKPRGPQPIEHGLMLGKGPLQGQDPNGHLTSPVLPSAGRSRPR